jgi:hypothetical protein
MIVSTECSKTEVETLPHDKIPTKAEYEDLCNRLIKLDHATVLKVSVAELTPSSCTTLYKILKRRNLEIKIKNHGAFRYLWLRKD